MVPTRQKIFGCLIGFLIVVAVTQFTRDLRPYFDTKELYIKFAQEFWNQGATMEFIEDIKVKRKTKEISKQMENTKVKARKPLPEVAIVPRAWKKYPEKKWRGLQLPVLTSFPMGRLGNVMGEYSTLLALGRIYGVTVRMLPFMRHLLVKLFPHLTMPIVPGPINYTEWIIIKGITFINYAKAEAAASGILGPHRFLLGDYPFEIQLFNTFRKDILKEFTFSQALQNKVKKYWSANLKNSTRVRIGIHVRRTDYVRFIKMFHSSLPGDGYFNRSTEYYRKKYPNAIFVVTSDDMAFVKKSFAKYKDVIFTPGTDRDEDLAIVASCNHSIITVGSFGFWCGYLTGGEVVYPNVTARKDYTFQKSLYDLGQLDFFTPLDP